MSDQLVMRTSFAMLLFLSSALTACSTPEMSGTQEVSYGGRKAEGVTQIQLQEELQRSSSQLIERVTQSYDSLSEMEDPESEQIALRHMLRIVSSVVDIMTGPYPEVNLLDMLAFTRLNRGVMEDYWIPEVYGAHGRELMDGFRRSEADLVKIADRVSTREQQQRLFDLVDTWRRENPKQIYVERVRLTDFAMKAGRVEEERDKQAKGLLASVKAAATSVDEASLLVNRALLLSKAMPPIIRLQARLGAQEVLSDSTEYLSEIGVAAGEAGPALRDLNASTARLEAILDRAPQVMSEFRRYFPRDTTAAFSEKLALTERITGNLTSVLQGLERISRDPGQEGFRVVRAEMDGFVWTVALALLLVGGGWAVFWWSGYYLYRRSYLRALTRAEQERDRSRRPPASGAAA